MKWMSTPSMRVLNCVEAVQPRLARAPVVAVGPVAAQLLGVGQRHALRPVGHRLLVGPAGGEQPALQVGQLLVAGSDAKGNDSVVHRHAGPVCTGLRAHGNRGESRPRLGARYRVIRITLPQPAAYSARHMNWVEIVWIGMSAASLTLGIVHLFVWFKHRSQRRPSAVLRARGLGHGLRRLRAGDDAARRRPPPTPATLRWAHVPLAMFVLSIVWFVYFHFDAGQALARLGGHRLAPAGAGAELRHRREHQLHRSLLAGPADIVGRRRRHRPGRQSPTPWAIVPQIGNLLLLAFVIDASITLWRRGGADARRRAVVVGGGVVVCIVAVAGFAALITLGLVHAPTIVMPGVFVIVLAMGYELGWDLIAAAQLASRLRASEMRFRAVVEAVPSAILLVDGKGTIALANAQAESLFGYHARRSCCPCLWTGWFPNAFAARTPACAALYATRPADPRDGRRPRAVCLSQGRQRIPGGGRAQPDGHRRGPVRAGVGDRHQRAQGARTGHGAPARRAGPPVAGGDAGRVVRLAGPRAEPAADGHPEQRAGGAALPGAEPAARGPDRRDPVRHREERSPGARGDPASALHAP